MKKKILGVVMGFLLIGINLFAADGDLIVNGNVGIGTTTPGVKLDVNGQIRANDVIQTSKGTANVWLGYNDGTKDYGIYQWQTPGTAPVNYIQNNLGLGTPDPGTHKLYVSGEAWSTGGWNQSSDLKFKENIAPIESPLSKILNLRGVSFNWRTEEFKDKGFPEDKHYGVIAEEIELVLPEVVKEGLEKEKGVSYTEIIPVLIEAMKEQQKTIEEQKREIGELRTAIELLKVR